MIQKQLVEENDNDKIQDDKNTINNIINNDDIKKLSEIHIRDAKILLLVNNSSFKPYILMENEMDEGVFFKSMLKQIE